MHNILNIMLLELAKLELFMNKEIPVVLLTGYLGSGKTTLLNRILNNRRGMKFAVIVNDIGEVNIDADLIQKGGIVGKKDDSLVALQNGCICCTLKMDLVEQVNEITSMGKFDYIAIEASGICEPAPIAQTLNSMNELLPIARSNAMPKLDCIVTVVDALRLKDEFACGDALKRNDLDDEDLERLVIEQIEFCNVILLNKASEVSEEELGRIKTIIRTIQPKAEIICCDYCDVDLDRIIGTGEFDFDSVATSAAWIHGVESAVVDDDDDDEHEHEHHHHEHEHEHHHHHDHGHHHDDEEGEAEEYGIGTFVYYRRQPFDINKFDLFVSRWPKNIIRAKGICYFTEDYDMCKIFEQAGRQFSLRDAGQWYATMPEYELAQMMMQDEALNRDWDVEYGDRMQKLVFIGQHLDKEAITKALDACLA